MAGFSFSSYFLSHGPQRNKELTVRRENEEIEKEGTYISLSLFWAWQSFICSLCHAQ
jgi:hypothetical protein